MITSGVCCDDPVLSSLYAVYLLANSSNNINVYTYIQGTQQWHRTRVSTGENSPELCIYGLVRWLGG